MHAFVFSCPVVPIWGHEEGAGACPSCQRAEAGFIPEPVEPGAGCLAQGYLCSALRACWHLLYQHALHLFCPTWGLNWESSRFPNGPSPPPPPFSKVSTTESVKNDSFKYVDVIPELSWLSHSHSFCSFSVFKIVTTCKKEERYRKNVNFHSSRSDAKVRYLFNNPPPGTRLRPEVRL